MEIKMAFRTLSEQPNIEQNEDSICLNKAIAILNLFNNNEHSNLIMLDGLPGSGKSTTIEALKKKLAEKDSSYQLIIYDVLNHHGDPIRRSFLDNLIKNLKVPEGEQENIKDLKARITDSKRIDSTKNKLSMSWRRVFSSGIILALPTLIPVIALTLSHVFLLLGWIQKNSIWVFLVSGFVGIILFLLSLKFWGNLLMFKTPFGQESITITTPENTAIEFNDHYLEIINLYRKESKNKLLVVIENLERLTDEEAEKIWVNIQNFIGIDNLEIQKNVKFIITFNSNNNAKSKSKTFIDKLPIIPFKMPVLTNTLEEKMFIKKLMEAFDDVDANVAREVFDIIKLYTPQALDSKNSIPPEILKTFTPRLIIRTINKMVAYAQYAEACGNEWNVKYLAISVRLVECDCQISRLFLDQNEYPLNNFFYDISDKTKMIVDVAAIVYGVSRIQAMEFSFASDLKLIISTNNPSHMLKMFQQYLEMNFDIVSVLSLEAKSFSFQNVCNLGALLSKCTFKDGQKEKISKFLFGLNDKFNDILSSTDSIEKSHENFKLLIDFMSQGLNKNLYVIYLSRMLNILSFIESRQASKPQFQADMIIRCLENGGVLSNNITINCESLANYTHLHSVLEVFLKSEFITPKSFSVPTRTLINNYIENQIKKYFNDEHGVEINISHGLSLYLPYLLVFDPITFGLILEKHKARSSPSIIYTLLKQGFASNSLLIDKSIFLSLEKYTHQLIEDANAKPYNYAEHAILAKIFILLLSNFSKINQTEVKKDWLEGEIKKFLTRFDDYIFSESSGANVNNWHSLPGFKEAMESFFNDIGLNNCSIFFEQYYQTIPNLHLAYNLIIKK
jgi:Cdc6-like AAA superfamily ATPase